MYKVVPVKLITPMAPLELERALPPEPIPPKPPEMYMPEETHIFDKPNYLPKPIPHSAKISPSSIPIPNPSVTTSKHMEPGYPNYSTRLYSIPGYSAFQPVSYSRKEQPSQPPPPLPVEVQVPEFNPYPTLPRDNHVPPAVEEKSLDLEQPVRLVQQQEIQKIQTDFEEHFTPEIIPATSVPDVNKMQSTESKMSITSLAQGSGATITIPSQIPNNEVKKKSERYSLKTSIPIGKLDMKCVSNPPDSAYQNSLPKKPFNPAFSKEPPRVEIQSNIVIKTATKEHEVKEPKTGVPSNSISTLLNAAEAINKTESNQHQFRVPEPKVDPPAEVKEPPALPRPIFNPMNIESSKVHLNKPPEATYNEQKNQIVFIQNKNNTNPKMLVTIQQQNPQMVQRSNFDSKNPPPPSRLTNQSKKSKEDAVNESTSSKVVALKKLHHENCDEDDFENLITENQIYGNKIVVKEKSQGTLQEQDIKNKKATEKAPPPEAKNVVLQPNFLYLSNVQFPGNLMMIKNNSKVPQNADCNKTKTSPTDNKVQNDIPIAPSTEACIDNKTSKHNVTPVSKEIHISKSSNNVAQTVANKTKPDVVIQSNQKVIVNSQIVYQVPVVSTVVEADKPKPPQVCSDFSKFVTPKKKYCKQFEQAQANEKPLFIACPYQIDANLQPKIVVTNVRELPQDTRPKVNKVDEVSALDIYEKRKRMRRLKYLCKRDKDVKAEAKKVEKSDLPNVITPDKVKNEVYKEFAKTKVRSYDASSGSDTDDYSEELKIYEDIIEEYGANGPSEKNKVDFMATLQLATLKAYKAKGQELQDKVLKHDSVAAAYAAVGRLDQLLNVKGPEDEGLEGEAGDDVSEEVTSGQKQQFMSRLQLTQVSQQYKDDYEKAWTEVLRERKRRNNPDTYEKAKHPRVSPGSLGFDPNCQLRLLTEIKKCVSDNNNLIKKRLDAVNADTSDESIPVLAEKNFSELNRLSKMADRSLKLFKVPNTRKRDLNPGFDSENIKKPAPQSVKVEQPYQNYPKIKIPNFSKIISLKSTQECEAVTSTPATSMDEPQNSAAGVTEMFHEPAPGRTRDVSCQAEEPPWSDIDNLMKSYKTYEAGRRREISDLRKRNTSLRVEGAHITRSASRDSDRSRALLAERQHLAVEENNLRLSLQRLRQAIEVIRNS